MCIWGLIGNHDSWILLKSCIPYRFNNVWYVYCTYVWRKIIMPSRCDITGCVCGGVFSAPRQCQYRLFKPTCDRGTVIVYGYMYVYVYVYIYIYTYNMRMFVWYVCIYIYTYAYVYLQCSMYVCELICIYIYIIYTRIYIFVILQYIPWISPDCPVDLLKFADQDWMY